MSVAQHSPHQNLRGIATRCAGVTCFALMSAAMKWASEDGANIIEMLFFRAAIGLPIVMIWFALGPGLGTVRTRRPGAHLLRAVFGVGSLAMVYQGLILLPIADAVTIGFSTPVFATLLSALLLSEKVGRHRWTAVAIGFVGVLVITQPGTQNLPLGGVVFAILGALSAGAATVMIRELGSSETPGAIVFSFFLCALIVSSIGMIFMAQRHEPFTWGLLVFGGLSGTGAQILLTRSLQLAPVSVVVPFDYSQILWAGLFGWLIWSTVPGPYTLLGAVLIVASGLYTAWREHRLNRERGAAATPLN